MIPCKVTLTGDREYAKNFIGAAQSQMRVLENQMSFQNLKQGVRRVRFNSRVTVEVMVCFNLKEVKIHCLPAIIKGIEKEFEKLPKLYVYATISDYVTIWDLLTGEVAEDVCDNDGHINDEDGNPLITFPCHKDDLVKWLDGIKDKPTRQVLKNEPINNRDYQEDNKLDIGNENRVESAHIYDPSFELYYGVSSPVYFTNIVRDELVDEKNPYVCYEYNCEVDPLEYYIYGKVFEKNIPDPAALIDCTPEECSDSFSCTRDFTYGKECFMKSHYMPYYRYRNCIYAIVLETEVEYIQKYYQRTKHLYLSPYPSLTFLRPDSDGGFESIEYSKETESAYDEAIDIECDNTKFSDSHWIDTYDWALKKDVKRGNVVSVNTKLGNLMIDYIPYKEWIEGTKRAHERMKDVTEDAFLSTYLRAGVCSSVSEWEARSNLGPDISGIYPEHAGEYLNWCRAEARNAVDIKGSESNRTGITWCGSPTPRDEIDEDGKVIKKAVARNWYRVILNFYMGGFHTGGREAKQNWYDSPFYCPNEEMCEELVEQYGGAGAECTTTSWSNKLIERFSSVQATIELEKPKDYPKKRSDTCEHCVACEAEIEGCVDGQRCTEHLRYKRPDEYVGHEEDFTQLCAFPGRTQGYEENQDNDTCYPFDGTYDIFTLGEAVEELINGHYVDGSDDQLLVYLYERPNMIKKKRLKNNYGYMGSDSMG